MRGAIDDAVRAGIEAECTLSSLEQVRGRLATLQPGQRADTGKPLRGGAFSG
jgi:hypothetical protein